MKKKDYMTIAVIIIISAAISIYVSGKIFVPKKNQQQTVQVVPPISSTISTPNPTYFNSKAIDPTQIIQIGNSSNPNLFVNNQ
jgi:ABC-type anion transport system duplicated permease subunit